MTDNHSGCHKWPPQWWLCLTTTGNISYQQWTPQLTIRVDITNDHQEIPQLTITTNIITEIVGVDTTTDHQGTLQLKTSGHHKWTSQWTIKLTNSRQHKWPSQWKVQLTTTGTPLWPSQWTSQWLPLDITVDTTTDQQRTPQLIITVYIVQLTTRDCHIWPFQWTL